MIQRHAYQCWRHYDIRLVFINQNDVICKFKFCVKVLRWFQIKLRKTYKFKGSISFVKNLSESEGVYRSRATMLIKGKSKPLQKQSSRGVLSKKVFLKISQNSQENIYARVAFIITFYVSACNFSKKEFSCEFCKIFKNTFFKEHLWTIANALPIYSLIFTLAFTITNWLKK